MASGVSPEVDSSFVDLTAPEAVLLCRGLDANGLSWGEMGGLCARCAAELCRVCDALEVCSRAIAGGGRANIDSMSELWTPFDSNAFRSVDPVGVGGGFGLGIVEVQQVC